MQIKNRANSEREEISLQIPLDTNLNRSIYSELQGNTSSKASYLSTLVE